MKSGARERCVAHRGGAGLAPENTVAAIDRTLHDGRAGWIEVDVHRSRDGELVVCHDVSVERTTDAAASLPASSSRLIADLDAAVLRDLDAGGWFGAAFAGVRLPTLDEVLDVVDDRVGLLVEVKGGATTTGIERALARKLKGRDPRTTMVWSSDADLLRRFSRVARDIPLGLFVREVDVDGLAPHLGFLAAVGVWPELHPHDVTEVHALGLRIAAATLNSPERMQAALTLGVDLVITDYPAVLAAVASGRWTPAGSASFDRHRTPVRFSLYGHEVIKVGIRATHAAALAGLGTEGGLRLRRSGGAPVTVIEVGSDGGDDAWVLIEAEPYRPGRGPTGLALHAPNGELADVIEYGPAHLGQDHSLVVDHVEAQ